MKENFRCVINGARMSGNRRKTKHGYRILLSVIKTREFINNDCFKPEIALLKNAHGIHLVTCGTTENNKIRYMFSLTSKHEQLLGFDKLSYSERQARTEQLYKSYSE